MVHIYICNIKTATNAISNQNEQKKGVFYVDDDSGGSVCLNAWHTMSQQPNDKVSFNSCRDSILLMFLLILKKMKSGEKLSPLLFNTLQMRILLSGRRVRVGEQQQRAWRKPYNKEIEREKGSVRKRHILTKDHTNLIHTVVCHISFYGHTHVPGV